VTKSDRRVRVVVGDDHPVYREGLVRALDSSGRTEVVAAVGDGRAALDAIREHTPDVALLDYKMPGLDGIAVAHAVVRDRLTTRVLLVSATTEGSVVFARYKTAQRDFCRKRRTAMTSSPLSWPVRAERTCCRRNWSPGSPHRCVSMRRGKHPSSVNVNARSCR
jgi:CheY-like chemotaxis protein